MDSDSSHPFPADPPYESAEAQQPTPSFSFQRSETPSEHDRYPIPARRNLLIVASQLAAAFAIFYAAANATSYWQLALLALAFGVLGNSIYAVVHEAEHRMLHPRREVNDLLGAAMALLFPAPYHLIRQGHIGHHQRNRSDDEAFDLYFDGENVFLRRLQLYGIITGAYWFMVALANVLVLVTPFLFKRKHFEFNRPSAAMMESLNPDHWGLIRLEALLAILLHVGIVVALGIPVLNYLIVYFGFGFSWSAMQYVHHYGTERHVLLGSRNLWIFAPLDWVWLHHNWHRTHHRHPTVPWIYLPCLGSEEDPRREFLLWHYLRMWRGPKRSQEHVKNRYAGRIIQ